MIKETQCGLRSPCRWISVWGFFSVTDCSDPLPPVPLKSRALWGMHGVENSSSDGQTNSVTPRRHRDNMALFRTTTALSEESSGFLGLQKHFSNILNFTVENEKRYFGVGGGEGSSHSVSPFVNEKTCENFFWLFSSSLMWPSALCQCLTKSKGRTGSSCIILFAQCRFD